MLATLNAFTGLALGSIVGPIDGKELSDGKVVGDVEGYRDVDEEGVELGTLVDRNDGVEDGKAIGL